ncbi:MAG: hypothetical protein JSV85_05535, partial [Candidatus Bathyarchaeota archaeon]
MTNISLKTMLTALTKTEDWWALWSGISLFVFGLSGFITTVPKPSLWDVNPFYSFSVDSFVSYLLWMVIAAAIFSISIKLVQGELSSFIPAFFLLSIVGLAAQVISKQHYIGTYGLEYVLWALIIGLIISNTIGVPKFLKPAIKT